MVDTRRRVSRSWLILWIALIASLTLLVVRPLAELFVIAAEEVGLRGGGALDRATAGSAAINSLMVGLAVALLAVVSGVGAAFITERSALAGRRWLRVAILLPLLVPPFVSALSWVRAYGPAGITDDAFGATFPGLYGPVGIMAVIAVNAMPLCYLIAVAALNTGAAQDLERAARISGAKSLRAFSSVTLPLLTPALLGAGTLSFVVALNSFGVPAVLGTPARFSTVTTRIYQDLARSARPEAFSRAILLACGLVVTALILSVMAEGVLGRTGRGPRTAAPAGPVVASASRGHMGAVLAWSFVTVTTVIPLLALVLVALTRAIGLPPVPANLTLSHFVEATSGRFLATLGRSLLLATAAGVVAVALGTAAAMAHRSRWGRPVSALVLLTFAVPGSTLAVAVLLSYGRALRDTLVIILIAYVAKLWAIGHRSVQGSIRSIPPELTWSARAAGATPWVTARTIVMPLLRPALFGGFVLVFLFAFHELTMSSLLYGPGTDTLAVAILNLQQIGDVPVSSALAVILTLPVLVVAIPLVAVGRLSRRLLGTG